MQTLQGFGYKVGLSKVRVTDERVKLRKFINNKKEMREGGRSMARSDWLSLIPAPR
jgi:hypothetical protein